MNYINYQGFLEIHVFLKINKTFLNQWNI